MESHLAPRLKSDRLLGVFSEFERTMIQERVRAGLATAKANGKRLGRPPISSAKEKRIRAARTEGKGIRRIAAEIGVGVGTAKRVVDAMPKT